MDAGTMIPGKVDFDRAQLDSEIDATPPKSVGLFCLLPQSIVRKIYPEASFGTERYPHWKF